MVIIVIIQMKYSPTNSLIKLKHFMNFSMKASFLRWLLYMQNKVVIFTVSPVVSHFYGKWSTYVYIT